MSKGMRTVVLAWLLAIGLGTANIAMADPIVSFWFEFTDSTGNVPDWMVELPLTDLTQPIQIIGETTQTDMFDGTGFMCPCEFRYDSRGLILNPLDNFTESGELFIQFQLFPFDPFTEGTQNVRQAILALYRPFEGPQDIFWQGPGELTITAHVIPEPATSVLLLSGLVMGGLTKRKRAREKRRSSRL